jgi:hypothetical protein
MRDLRKVGKNPEQKQKPEPTKPKEDLEPEEEQENEEEAIEEETKEYSYHSGSVSPSGISIIPIIAVISIFALALIIGTVLISGAGNNIDLGLPTAQPTPTIQIGHFTGTLAVITYDQTGYGGSVSNTHILFSDGNSFVIEGNANYAIGLNYTVTYQYYKNADNGDTVVTHTDDVQLAP